MKKILAAFVFIAVCVCVEAQKYDALDKYWLPQECNFNMQDASLRFAANSSKDITLGEVINSLFKGKSLTFTKMSLLCNSKVTTLETADEIKAFDILSPVKIVSGTSVRFDLADYLLIVEGNIGGKNFSDIVIYVCNASGAADKSMYRNVTVMSNIWNSSEVYSTKNFLVAYDYQTRAEAEKRFAEMCAPALEKIDNSSEELSDFEYTILETRNTNLLYKTGLNNAEFDQNRDAIATFLGAYKRLVAELKAKGYNDAEKMRFSMKLASEIANNYIKIGKPEMAYQYLYHAQNMGRQLNEYKYALAYVKTLTDIDRGQVASKLASEMKSKGLDLTDAATYKALAAIK